MSPVASNNPSLIGIRASAGSGKTYRLTIEYLKKFFAGAEPESILATTFTKTAASEILARVLRRMAEACVDPGKRDRLADDLGVALSQGDIERHLRRFCSSLDRVSIGTIDSFFSGITACYRYETDLAVGGSVYDEHGSASKRVRVEALRNVLDDHEKDTLSATVDRLQGGIPSRSVVEKIDSTLLELLSLYETTRPEHWDVVRSAPPLTEQQLASAVAALSRFQCHGAKPSIIQAIDKARVLAIKGEWREITRVGIGKSIQEGVPTFSRQEITDDIRDVFQPFIEHVKALTLADHNEKTAAAYALLQKLSPEYTRLRQAQGMTFYSDVPLALSKLISELDHGELSHRLNRRIDHLLLDEFQDTDPRQAKILGPFTDRISTLTDSAASIFWVGDTKQAIYGWRGARAEIFDQLERVYPEINWDQLSESYRSSQIVLDTVNQIFADLGASSLFERKPGMAEAAARWSSGYVTHKAHRHLPGYVAVIQAPADNSADSESESESAGDTDETSLAGGNSYVAFVCRRIAEIHEQAPGRSVGVLTRTNKMADSILFQLRRSSITAAAHGGAPLVTDPAAALVMAALGLADRPGDSVAGFSVLNSPLADIVQLKDLTPYQLRQASLRIRETLASLGYAPTLIKWARVLAPSCDSRGARRLAYLVELADQFDQNPGLRPRDFLDIARDSGCSDPSSAPVQVMSIHKAKGLEFDSVVLPELHGRIPGKTPPVVTDTDNETLEVVGVSRYPKKDVAKLHPQLQKMYDQYLANTVKESLCLLYVAVTRPRHSLTIIAPTPKNKTLSMFTLLRDRLDLKRESTPIDGGEVIYEQGNPDWAQELIKLGTSSSQVPTEQALPEFAPPDPMSVRLSRHSTPSSLEEWGAVRAEQLLAGDSTLGKRTGSIVHSFFQNFGWVDDGIPSKDDLVRSARRSLPGERLDLIIKFAGNFESIVTAPAMSRALRRPNQEPGETLDLWLERSFATMIDNRFVSGKFDRVVLVTKDNKPISAHIFDYKTTDMSSTTVKAETDRYRPQMQTYRRALSTMLGLPEEKIKCTLLFTNSGEAVEIHHAK